MLEELLNHLNNRFEVACESGEFAVEGGELKAGCLQDGQYFWIEGSVFNDGLHRHPARDLADEEFDGRVALLAVPRAVVELSHEIGRWREENAKALDSPYQSESFDGYSYSKEPEAGSGSAASWQSHFRNRLHTWRKLP